MRGPQGVARASAEVPGLGAFASDSYACLGCEEERRGWPVVGGRQIGEENPVQQVDSGGKVRIGVHHLGHAAFVLRFGKDLTVLTDYGAPNAWAEWGWDSPIHGIGALVPDVITTSHGHHEDHYDATRVPEGAEHRLTETDRLELRGVRIEPFRTCEQEPSVADNTSFLFSYRGARILHLGDAQATIAAHSAPAIQEQLGRWGWQDLDLLIMPIEGKIQFIDEAAAFLDLLRPRRMIPIHHWTESYRQAFLDALASRPSGATEYAIHRIGPSMAFSPDDPAPSAVEIWVTEPSSYAGC